MSPTGNNSSSGLSPTSAWKTFAHAIPKLNSGDTLILMDGQYTTAQAGNVSIDCAGGNAKNGIAAKPIPIKAQNQRKAHIKNDGTGRAFMLTQCSYWIVDGLTITSQDNPSYTGEGMLLTVSDGDPATPTAHNIIRNNLLANVNRYSSGGGCLILYGSEVQYNLVEGNECYNSDSNSMYGLSSSHNIFRRNYCRPCRQIHPLDPGTPSAGTDH
jgi:hypothetical protein